MKRKKPKSTKYDREKLQRDAGLGHLRKKWRKFTPQQQRHVRLRFDGIADNICYFTKTEAGQISRFYDGHSRTLTLAHGRKYLEHFIGFDDLTSDEQKEFIARTDRPVGFGLLPTWEDVLTPFEVIEAQMPERVHRE